MNKHQKVDRLKDIILEEVLTTSETNKIVSPSGEKEQWLFDFRNIFLKPDHLDLLADIIWSELKYEFPFQIGGSESAAIPLITAIVLKSKQVGKPVNGFYLRKSRKNVGLQKMLEGELNSEKIILVDDLINSGASIQRQVEILEKMGRKIHTVFPLVIYRPFDYYFFLREKKIKIKTLFTLSDFNLSLSQDQKKERQVSFRIKWYFQSPDPDYFYIIPKSGPIIDKTKVYFGSDSGYFWALNQRDGTVSWKYKIKPASNGKSIFSTPLVYKDTVFFGAYDGNVYALDAISGKERWRFAEADWVGSSPAIAPKLNLLFIGLEFGLFRKQGGIIALVQDTGEKKWEYKMPDFVHSSPAYYPDKNIVVVGCNDSSVYCFDAKNGELIWRYETSGSIKSSFAFDKKRNTVLFGSFDGHLYVLDVMSGQLKGSYQTDSGIYSTPLVQDNLAYVSSTDKKMYSFDLEQEKLNWSFETGGRIFSSPEIINGSILIGSNNGGLYELNATTGALKGSFQLTERITNKITYNIHSKMIFLPTYANEIYCLERLEHKNESQGSD